MHDKDASNKNRRMKMPGWARDSRSSGRMFPTSDRLIAELRASRCPFVQLEIETAGLEKEHPHQAAPGHRAHRVCICQGKGIRMDGQTPFIPLSISCFESSRMTRLKLAALRRHLLASIRMRRVAWQSDQWRFCEVASSPHLPACQDFPSLTLCCR